MRLYRSLFAFTALLSAALVAGEAAGQHASDPLCSKYAGVVVGTNQGKPVRPDCQGLRNMIGDLGGLMVELGESMAALREQAARRPFTEILAGDPMIAQQCRQATTATGTLYRCALSPVMLMSVPVGGDGKAERVRVDFDIEKHVQMRLASAGITVNDVVYDIYRDMLTTAKSRGGQSLPLTVNGRRAVLDFPVGAR